MGRLPGATVEEALLLNHVVEGECWRWTGAHTPKGYGQLSAQGKPRSVHRLAYELWVGPIDSDLEVDHLCFVRDCINPEHLEAVTHQVNLQRMQLRATHCRHGHEWTPENTKVTNRGNAEEQRRCRQCYNAQRRRLRADRKARERTVVGGAPDVL